jgi:hypothetical protein
VTNCVGCGKIDGHSYSCPYGTVVITTAQGTGQVAKTDWDKALNKETVTEAAEKAFVLQDEALAAVRNGETNNNSVRGARPRAYNYSCPNGIHEFELRDNVETCFYCFPDPQPADSKGDELGMPIEEARKQLLADPEFKAAYEANDELEPFTLDGILDYIEQHPNFWRRTVVKKVLNAHIAQERAKAVREELGKLRSVPAIQVNAYITDRLAELGGGE